MVPTVGGYVLGMGVLIVLIVLVVVVCILCVLVVVGVLIMLVVVLGVLIVPDLMNPVLFDVSVRLVDIMPPVSPIVAVL